MKREKKGIGVDRKIVEGKPYLGLSLGDTMIINQKHPVTMQQAIDMLPPIDLPQGVECRDESNFYRPSFKAGPLLQNAVVGRKYLAWGRAYKVHRHVQKLRSKRKFNCQQS